MIKVQLDQLLEKEMDRKDFLKHAGIAFVAFIGVTSLVKRFTNVANESFGTINAPKTAMNVQASGYGVAAYSNSVAGR